MLFGPSLRDLATFEDNHAAKLLEIFLCGDVNSFAYLIKSFANVEWDSISRRYLTKKILWLLLACLNTSLRDFFMESGITLCSEPLYINR